MRKLFLGLALVSPMAFAQVTVSQEEISMFLTPTGVCAITPPTTQFNAAPTFKKNAAGDYLMVYWNQSQTKGKVISAGYDKVRFETTATTPVTTFVNSPTMHLDLNVWNGSTQPQVLGLGTTDVTLVGPTLEYAMSGFVIKSDAASKGFKDTAGNTSVSIRVSCVN